MVFNKILVPITPEQPINESLHQALQLANHASAHVTLLSVIKHLEELTQVHQFSGSALDILEKATYFYQQALKEHVKQLQPLYPNITFETHIRIGIPFIEIVKQAHESNCSMVMIDSYRRAKKQACQRGSNTLSLMRKSEIPIWSLSKEPRQISNVVAAVDLTNQEYQQFNIKLVALAVEFCSQIGANLTFCHAWKLESEDFLRDWSRYAEIDIALLAQKMRDERLDRLNQIVKPYIGNPRIQIQMIEGEPKEVLPQYVADNNVDLVILGSMSRTGISGFVMGNTAESMINQLCCSVITLKPDSFKSPILNP